MSRPSASIGILSGGLFFLTATIPLAAQTQSPPGGGLQEQRPTAKDPRYNPPQIPGYIQDDQSAEDVILSPAGGLDPEKVQRALLKKQERSARSISRFREREYYERAQTEAGRRAIERDILEKFGVERFPYEKKGGKHEHHESAGRRFQVVFFLSLPITAIFVGGGITLAKQARGDNSRLTLEETGSAIAGGMVFSALIGWYDHRRWVRFQRERIEAEGGAWRMERRGLELAQEDTSIGFERRPDLRLGLRFAF